VPGKATPALDIGIGPGPQTLRRRPTPWCNSGIDRFAMETKRQLDVLNRRLADNEYVAGNTYTSADVAIFPWHRCMTTVSN
jgi:glutathione S-transferase